MKKEDSIVFGYKEFCKKFKPLTALKTNKGDLITEKDFCCVKFKNEINEETTYVLSFDFKYDLFTNNSYPVDLNILKDFLEYLNSMPNDILIYSLGAFEDGCKWREKSSIKTMIDIFNCLSQFYIGKRITITSHDDKENNSICFIGETTAKNCVFSMKINGKTETINGSSGVIVFKTSILLCHLKEIEEFLTGVNKALQC